MENELQNTPSVAILVVSYNAEKHIEKTLLSCLNQTYQNFEVLLLDNNSTDGTVKIVENIQKKDERLKIYKSENNLGPYAGLNFLLEQTKRKYIAIQDHDDIWFPEKIEKQVGFLEKNLNYVGCGTRSFYYFESKEILILNQKPGIVNFVDHTSLIFRNKGFRYNAEHILADEDFEKRILGNSGKIACLPEGLTIHRLKKDGTNLSLSRFTFSTKNISQYFVLNKVNFQSIIILVDIFFRRVFPEPLLWLIRRKITLRNSVWISLKDFCVRYPMIHL